MLHDQIIKNTKIQGILLGDIEVKAIQFADDLNMPLLFKQEVLDAVLAELELFQKQVGLSINLSKSYIYKIGLAKNTSKILFIYGIPIEESVKVLGIDIASKNEIEKLNVDPLIQKMQCVADMWKTRDLSLVGKVLVINTLLMSLLVYRLSVLPLLSKVYIDRINKIWSSFLWNAKSRKYHGKL